MLLRWDNEAPGQVRVMPSPMPTWDGVGYVPSYALPTFRSGHAGAKASWDAAASDLGGIPTTPEPEVPTASAPPLAPVATPTTQPEIPATPETPGATPTTHPEIPATPETPGLPSAPSATLPIATPTPNIPETAPVRTRVGIAEADKRGKIRVRGQVVAGHEVSSDSERVRCRTNSRGRYRCRGRGLAPGQQIEFFLK